MFENNDTLDSNRASAVNVSQDDYSGDKLCHQDVSENVENVLKSTYEKNQSDDLNCSSLFAPFEVLKNDSQNLSAGCEDAACEIKEVSETVIDGCHEGTRSHSIDTEELLPVSNPSPASDLDKSVCSNNIDTESLDKSVCTKNIDPESLPGPSELIDDQQQKTSETVTEEICNPVSPYSTYLFDKHKRYQISRTWKEFCKNGNDSFLKGCKWAPDGSCIITNSEEKKLKIFDLHQELYTQKIWPKDRVKLLPGLKKTVEVMEGGRIYDYCWFPLMNSWDPPSCCFVSSATDEPVHLWDAFDGSLRASYSSRNYAEEIMSPFSLCFSPDGETLFCGFKNKIDIFNVCYPGIKPTSINTKALMGQSGLVSTIAVNPALPDLFAVGTFQKSVGLYSLADKCGICMLNGHSGGLTHLMFSSDGSRLYSGSRMDPEIVCWDLRNPGKVLFSMYRCVTTNQRIYFDLTPDGKYFVSGNTNGCVSIWNLDSDKLSNGDVEPVDPDIIFQAHRDCTNGVSINKQYPILATSSGQRHFPDILGDCDNDDQTSAGNIFDCDSLTDKKENCINLWWIGPVS